MPRWDARQMAIYSLSALSANEYGHLDAVSLKTLYLWVFRTVERSGLNRVEGRIVCAGPLRRLRVQCPRYPVRQRLNGGRTQIIGRHALRGAEAREVPVLRAVIKLSLIHI